MFLEIISLIVLRLPSWNFLIPGFLILFNWTVDSVNKLSTSTIFESPRAMTHQIVEKKYGLPLHGVNKFVSL